MKSLQVERVLKKLGADIQAARKRRRISTQNMADRIRITRQTLARLEKGDPKVAMGTYAAAILVLGKLKELENLFQDDKEAMMMYEAETLPKRIRN